MKFRGNLRKSKNGFETPRIMSLLFPIKVHENDIPPITGLSYYPAYISSFEEQQLSLAIEQGDWDCSWERRRQLFGGSYGKERAITPAIPLWGKVLADRIFQEDLTVRPFDHMLVNQYLPGQGIAMHLDYQPYDRTVVSLSLLAPCVMDFRNLESGERHSLLLEPRSLLVLSDDARYKWQHGIARRKNDRWHGIQIPRARRLSITFRMHVI